MLSLQCLKILAFLRFVLAFDIGCGIGEIVIKKQKLASFAQSITKVLIPDMFDYQTIATWIILIFKLQMCWFHVHVHQFICNSLPHRHAIITSHQHFEVLKLISELGL